MAIVVAVCHFSRDSLWIIIILFIFWVTCLIFYFTLEYKSHEKSKNKRTMHVYLDLPAQGLFTAQWKWRSSHLSLSFLSGLNWPSYPDVVPWNSKEHRHESKRNFIHRQYIHLSIAVISFTKVYSALFFEDNLYFRYVNYWALTLNTTREYFWESTQWKSHHIRAIKYLVSFSESTWHTNSLKFARKLILRGAKG